MRLKKINALTALVLLHLKRLLQVINVILHYKLTDKFKSFCLASPTMWIELRFKIRLGFCLVYVLTG